MRTSVGHKLLLVSFLKGTQAQISVLCSGPGFQGLLLRYTRSQWAHLAWPREAWPRPADRASVRIVQCSQGITAAGLQRLLSHRWGPGHIPYNFVPITFTVLPASTCALTSLVATGVDKLCSFLPSAGITFPWLCPHFSPQRAPSATPPFSPPLLPPNYFLRILTLLKHNTCVSCN